MLLKRMLLICGKVFSFVVNLLWLAKTICCFVILICRKTKILHPRWTSFIDLLEIEKGKDSFSQFFFPLHVLSIYRPGQRKKHIYLTQVFLFLPIAHKENLNKKSQTQN